MHTVKGLIYGEDFRFHRGEIDIEEGIFSRVSLEEDPISWKEGKEERPEERYIIPGLTDIHFHGSAGYDFSGCDYEGLKAIASYLAKNGVTSFTVASMTQSEEVLAKAYRNAARFRREQPEQSAEILGINMEGPFFSVEKRGAQAQEHLRLPDLGFVSRLDKEAEGLLKIVCVAPELPGAMEFIRKASEKYTVSLAHTTADYGTAKEGFSNGASLVTHLFNAMQPLHHREPGLIGAAAEDEAVMAELICDGVHLHESVVRAAFRLFGPERIILISDCLSPCGAEGGGAFLSGGVPITLKNGAAVLSSDGVTLAGSATTLLECMRQAISFGVAPEAAVRAATFNPVKVIGETKQLGTIAMGKKANFLVCNSSFQLIQSFVRGILVFE